MLQAVRRRWWMVLLCALVGLAAGAGAATVLPRTYASTTLIYVSLGPDATAGDVLNSSTFVEQRAQTYAELAQGEAFERAVSDVTGAGSPPELSAQIRDNTVLLAITAEAATAPLARQGADAAATLLIQRAAQLEARGNGTASLQLRVVEEANLPEVAGFPTPPVLLVLGVLVGVAVGTVASVASSRMNTRLRRRSDLVASAAAERATWLTPAHGEKGGDELSSALLAIHRQLVTASGSHDQVVVVAGCTADDTSTARVIADRTAATLARAGTSVALVLLDDSPRNRPGLSDLIERATTPGAAAAPRADAVRVLGSGTKPLRVWSATNVEVEATLRTLLNEVDAIVIVAPPLISSHPFPATAYIRSADALMLVGTQGRSSRHEVESAVELADRWGLRSVHAVLAAPPSPRHELTGDAPRERRTVAAR